jgi:hypothetical protein
MIEIYIICGVFVLLQCGIFYQIRKQNKIMEEQIGLLTKIYRNG